MIDLVLLAGAAPELRRLRRSARAFRAGAFAIRSSSGTPKKPHHNSAFAVGRRARSRAAGRLLLAEGEPMGRRWSRWTLSVNAPPEIVTAGVFAVDDCPESTESRPRPGFPAHPLPCGRWRLLAGRAAGGLLIANLAPRPSGSYETNSSWVEAARPQRRSSFLYPRLFLRRPTPSARPSLPLAPSPSRSMAFGRGGCGGFSRRWPAHRRAARAPWRPLVGCPPEDPEWRGGRRSASLARCGLAAFSPIAAAFGDPFAPFHRRKPGGGRDVSAGVWRRLRVSALVRRRGVGRRAPAASPSSPSASSLFRYFRGSRLRPRSPPPPVRIAFSFSRLSLLRFVFIRAVAPLAFRPALARGLSVFAPFSAFSPSSTSRVTGPVNGLRGLSPRWSGRCAPSRPFLSRGSGRCAIAPAAMARVGRLASGISCT